MYLSFLLLLLQNNSVSKAFVWLFGTNRDYNNGIILKKFTTLGLSTNITVFWGILDVSEIFGKIDFRYLQILGIFEILITFMAEPCVFLAIPLKQCSVLCQK